MCVVVDGEGEKIKIKDRKLRKKKRKLEKVKEMERMKNVIEKKNKRVRVWMEMR